MKNKNIGIDGLEQHPGRQPQPPAPIKEDTKHTAGELPEKLDVHSTGLFPMKAELHPENDPDGLIILADVQSMELANEIAKRYNQAPTLLKENEQLKAEIERLRKWAVETIDISQNLAHKRKEQVNVLREALRNALEELGGLLEESDNQFGRDNNGVYQEGKIILSQTETN